MRENIRKNKGQSPIQVATVILVIVALIGSWMAYSSAGQAATKGLAEKTDVKDLKKDLSSLKNKIANLTERIKALKEAQSSIIEKIGAKRPAKLAVTSISAPSVKVGEEATVKVTVTNTGEKAGSMEVAPTIKGEEIGSKTVELEPGETTHVEFTVRKEEAGEYTVSAGEETAILSVSKPKVKPILIGHSPLFTRDEFFRTLVRATQYYCQTHKGISQNWMNPHNTSSSQIKDLKYMIKQKVDGIIASPISPSACASVVDTAHNKNIPVVTYNTDASTKNVAACVMVNNETLGAAAAKALIKKMKNAGVELEGTAVIDGGDKTWPQARARTKGFAKVFEQYDGIEIVKYWNEGWDMKKAKDKMSEYLIAHGKPLIAVGVNNTTNSGVIKAMREKGVLVPRSKPNEHVWTGFIGLNTVVQKAMKNGYADVSSNQPNLIYGTLALYLVERCIRNGPTPLADPGDLPEPGDKIVAKPDKPRGELEEGTWNLALPKPTTLAGVDISRQKWTPCPVVEKDGHPWIVTKPLVVNPENAYTAPVYVNLAPKWLK